MSFKTPIIEKAEAYVREFLSKNFTDKICYHNIDHTLEVVEAAEKIGNKCKLSVDEMEVVILAAWFHDTGYYKGNVNHELESSNIASQFLKEVNAGQGLINHVDCCIKATKIPQNPKTITEKVICDADLYHLSTPKFFTKSELLRKELVAHHCHISPKSWMAKSCMFVSQHNYFTEFAKKILKPKKQANLRKLEMKIARKSD